METPVMVNNPAPATPLTTAQKLTLSWTLAVRGGKHSYEGTVPDKVIAQRRAKNKVAKASRKANR